MSANPQYALKIDEIDWDNPQDRSGEESLWAAVVLRGYYDVECFCENFDGLLKRFNVIAGRPFMTKALPPDIDRFLRSKDALERLKAELSSLWFRQCCDMAHLNASVIIPKLIAPLDERLKIADARIIQRALEVRRQLSVSKAIDAQGRLEREQRLAKRRQKRLV